MVKYILQHGLPIVLHIGHTVLHATIHVAQIWYILMRVFFPLLSSIYEVPTVSASLFTRHFQQLLAEADETDSIHDVTFQAGDRVFPTHKYILSMRSEFFRKQLLPEAGQGDKVDGEVKRSVDAVGCDLLVLENISPDLLEQALHFIYTDSCEMLVHGARPTISHLSHGPEQKQKQQQQLISSLQDLNVSGRSALEIYRSLPASVLSQREKPMSKGAKSGKKEKGDSANESSHNPVKMLQGVAKKLGLGSLSARWDFLISCIFCKKQVALQQV